MRLIGIAGYSGSGKTTLIKKLIPLLIGKGYRVATVKHAHHKFDIDKPGKDSLEHRQAGANQVLIASKTRWALMNENRDEVEPKLPFLLSQLSDIDFVLVEGFKSDNHPKVEVVRADGTERLSVDVPNIVATASDTPLTDGPGNWDLNTPSDWIDALIAHAVDAKSVDW